MPNLWKSAATVLSADSCALRYEASLIVGLIPCAPIAAVHLGGLIQAWHERITAAVGPVSGGHSSTHAGKPDSRSPLAKRSARCKWASVCADQAA